MSREDELLRRLAEACGISSEYTDIWGKPQRVSSATQRALLAAMGVHGESGEELQRELDLRETRSWRRVLEPVLVVRQPHDELMVPLAVADARAAQPWRWTLVREDGHRDERDFVPAELEPVEIREVDGARVTRRLLSLGKPPVPGYHRIEIVSPEGELASMRLIVAPPRCHLPPALEGDGRTFGPAAQLYALSTGRDWGIGDFGALASLVDLSAEVGAGMVGVNPLHALFPANPHHISPYSPSSRVFLHWLYLDVEAIPELSECEEARRLLARPEFQARIAALRDREQIDHEGVAAAKREVLERLYRHFRRAHLDADTQRGREFRAYVAERGPALERYGVFEALEERFRPDGAWGWPVWPEEYRSPESGAVSRFADEHRDRVDYFCWLQWECDRQLGGVGDSCYERGLAVGLYLDMAVSVDRAGFETWCYPQLYAVDAGIGAPPDDFNLQGQNWGLPPWIPERLREAGYQPLIDALSSNMRHAGALRIDHVMALMRLFWVPPGRPATEGAYVRYPFEEMLGILALESTRNSCLVVGEDLGTVPDEVRQALRPLGVLSYRLLYSSQTDGGFTHPADFPRQSLVAITTHDLPTLHGWWQARDVAVRAELGLIPDERQHEEQVVSRGRDRTGLLVALRREGLLPGGEEADLGGLPTELSPELAVAVHAYLARSPAMLMTFQLEDLLGQVDQVNLPGTTSEYSNWRIRLPDNLEALAADARLDVLGAALRAERGSGVAPGGRRSAGPRIPVATYRLQLHRGFPLARARELLPYLAELGISHCYLSPILQARSGSLHGYDIIDHGSLNAEITSFEEFEQFVEDLQSREMGLILDMVPNHMGVGSDNAWWMSVLEHGQTSPHAAFFDIDWRPFKPELRGRVLLPLLEDHYGRVLERGLLRLRFDEVRGAFEVAYHEHRFPLDPATYPRILAHDLSRLEARLGTGDPRPAELQSLIAALGNLPGRDETDAARVRDRLRDAEVLCRRLARLAGESGEIAGFVAANVRRFDGTIGDPSSFDELDALLGEQAYRLAFWRTAADEINYRRFFDINDLAGLRMEERRAFDETHRLVLDLARRGRIDGLRIDHPDGLHDPAGYYRNLQQELDGPSDQATPPLWLVVEKILAAHESLPDDWVVHGTTGYDFCNEVGGLFVDAEAERAMDRIYHRFVGRRMALDSLLRDSKLLILNTALSSELTVLTNDLDRISESDRRTRDFTRDRLRQALAEVIACFPVYRTYVSEDSATEEDRRHVEWAVARARKLGRAHETSIYDFLRDVLLLDAVDRGSVTRSREVVRFARKFQQLTGPVMAKGFEDTTFYIYNRMLALNEVGGEPGRFGTSPAAFHRANRDRMEKWPHSMLCTSTHDSKRSEDSRVRIAALSEDPERWERALRRFAALNRTRRGLVDGHPAPSRNDEYAIYQTLVGVWPDEHDVDLDDLRERVKAWAIKAVREAKVHSSWMVPDEAYEQATTAFLDAILGDPQGAFLREFEPLQRWAAGIGRMNSLSQTLLKLTSPGVPDIYQGNETTALALVDPDNRRPVDYERRRRMLAELSRLEPSAGDETAARTERLMHAASDGRAKLWVHQRALALRGRHAGLFARGAYLPLEVDGARAAHVVAFVREREGRRVVAVAPRLYATLCDPASKRYPVGARVWDDTRIDLAPGTYLDALTDRTIVVRNGLRLGDLLSSFPVALLEQLDDEP